MYLKVRYNRVVPDARQKADIGVVEDGVEPQRRQRRQEEATDAKQVGNPPGGNLSHAPKGEQGNVGEGGRPPFPSEREGERVRERESERDVFVDKFAFAATPKSKGAKQVGPGVEEREDTKHVSTVDGE